MPWTVTEEENGEICARFEGYLDRESGEASAREVIRLLGDSRRDLVLHVPKLGGYHREARQAWQQLLWEHRTQLTQMIVVGGNSAVRMGASVMAMFLGVPLRVREVDPLLGASDSNVPVKRPRSASGSVSSSVSGRRRSGRHAWAPAARRREASRPIR